MLSRICGQAFLLRDTGTAALSSRRCSIGTAYLSMCCMPASRCMFLDQTLFRLPGCHTGARASAPTAPAAAGPAAARLPAPPAEPSCTATRGGRAGPSAAPTRSGAAAVPPVEMRAPGRPTAEGPLLRCPRPGTRQTSVLELLNMPILAGSFPTVFEAAYTAVVRRCILGGCAQVHFGNTCRCRAANVAAWVMWHRDAAGDG